MLEPTSPPLFPFDARTASDERSRQPGQVLVVEDNPVTRATVVRTMESAGITVVCATTGAEALHAAAIFRPDLVLLDINLPDICGREVCRRLKQDPALDHVLVAHLSAERTSATDRMHGLDTGADAYLTHPITPGELIAHVRSMLRLKRTEQALRESRDLYRTLVEQAPIGIAHLTLDGAISSVNHHFASLLGTTPETLARRPFARLVHAEERARFSETLTALAHEIGASSWKGTLRLPVANDAIVWVEVIVQLHRDVEHVPQHFIAAVQDITARRAAETVQRERDELACELFEKSSDLIAFVGPDHRIARVNSAFVRALGFEKDALLGQPLEIFLASDSRARWRAGSSRALTGERSDNVRLELSTECGGTLPVNATLARHDAGGIVQVRAVFRDISEVHGLEQQLLRAQRLESIGTLAGGIAHDLNNVLSPILLCAGLARTAPTAKEQQEFLSIIEKSTLRASGLVRQVLSFARGVEGEKTPLQLRHVAKDTVAMLRGSFPKDIRIVNDLPPDLWLVHANVTQLSQIFVNLCVNARDAMPAGGTLTLAGRNHMAAIDEPALPPDARPGPYVVVTISDTGTGIAAEIRDRIFEPFFTTKEQGKGTGLGLSTVLGIVRAHGGFVAVESTEGKGTTFQLHLPAHAAAVPAAETPVTAPTPRGAGELVLVVDDERPVRTMIERTLRDHGFRVVTATDGIDAVARFMAFGAEIKVVVTDVVMPRLDGQAVAQAIHKSYPNTRIIAISGNAPDHLVEQPQSACIDAFIPKPFTCVELLRAVHTMLEPASASSQETPTATDRISSA